MKRIVSIQDISCVGKCSLTVALPIISSMGVETSIVPTAVLSTHTQFKGFTFRDLTDDMLPILDHWKKEGFKFKEWNTAKNGGGISYKGGEDITLVGDCTLYAVWEDTSSVTFKIDSVMAQAAEFLSQESIPGVSNFLLTIGVITTVVSLIAVIAIARK